MWNRRTVEETTFPTILELYWGYVGVILRLWKIKRKLLQIGEMKAQTLPVAEV